MEIRTFEGFSIKDAVQKVKKQFGSDAVILTTKEKYLEDSDTKVIEVKAAVGESIRKNGASSPSYQVGSLESGSTEARISVVERLVKSIEVKAATKNDINRLEAGLKELKMLSLHSLRQGNRHLKADLEDRFESLFQQLQIIGVEDTLLLDIINHLRTVNPFESSPGGENGEEYYRSQAIKYMFRKIRIHPRLKPIDGQAQVHLFVGASGVGKSCTIAKIAAKLINHDKANVLLVSYDNKGVLSSDLLSIYSKVLGFNHVMIDSPDELEALTLKYRNSDFILVDTKGGIPKQEKELDSLRKVKDKPFPIDVHLVLSLTENSHQMDRTITAFSYLGIQSIAFTRLDESWKHGEMYNISCRWSIPYSFFSTGDNVPNDLEIAKRERVIGCIFGL